MKTLTCVHITFYHSTNRIQFAFHREGMDVKFFYAQVRNVKRLLCVTHRMGLQPGTLDGGLWFFL